MSNVSKSEAQAELLTQAVAKHQVSVWRYLRSLGCAAEEAEDLTQETFLKVWEKPYEELSDVATRVYLRTVARNMLIDRRRKQGRHLPPQTIESIDQFWSKSDHQQPDELLELLGECLAGLTDRARMALGLRFREKKSRTEIAAALEIGEHGAKNLMQRAKQQLRECIEEKLAQDNRR